MTPARIQLSRRKGWRKPEGAISVARPNFWGNPFKCDPARAVRLHRLGMTGRFGALHRELGDIGDIAWMALESYFRHAQLRLPELRGKSLACWCKEGSPCHADTLIELANGAGEPSVSH